MYGRCVRHGYGIDRCCPAFELVTPRPFLAHALHEMTGMPARDCSECQRIAAQVVAETVREMKDR